MVRRVVPGLIANDIGIMWVIHESISPRPPDVCSRDSTLILTSPFGVGRRIDVLSTLFFVLNAFIALAFLKQVLCTELGHSFVSNQEG